MVFTMKKTKQLEDEKVADVCLIAEGSYPYISGGVAYWAHELIKEQKERTFHVLTLMPPNTELDFHYHFPPNVIGHTVYIVEELPEGAASSKAPDGMWEVLFQTLKGLISSPKFEDFGPLLALFENNRDLLGKRILCESKEVWNTFLKLYETVFPSGPFKDYFSLAYTLSRSISSLLLPKLPPAKIYHALCTGYAGFVLHRAKKERGGHCLVTEQGIYSNERRIEISMASWISDVGSLNLDIMHKNQSLKDYWLNAFLSLSHVCFISCDDILSTFEGNQESELTAGADPAKVRTIVHGIHLEEYKNIERKERNEAPVVAFVGRIVPIKDVKTFIRACWIIKDSIENVKFYALGPTEEDPDYFAECQHLVQELGLENEFTFFGEVNLREYFPKIDVVVLTSISEAQPRSVMEAGAIGIPSVLTDVGACRQLLYGKEDESPSLGQGGIVTQLVNPPETAQAVIQLLEDDAFYESCSQAIKKRMQLYYNFQDEQEAYRNLYKKYLTKETSQ